MTAGGSQSQSVSKKVGETAPIPFDFTSCLASGETISTKTVTASVYTGVDAAPASIISGAASSSGPVVTQNITAGVSGVIYTLLCTVVTSLARTFQISSFLAVVPNIN